MSAGGDGPCGRRCVNKTTAREEGRNSQQAAGAAAAAGTGFARRPAVVSSDQSGPATVGAEPSRSKRVTSQTAAAAGAASPAVPRSCHQSSVRTVTSLSRDLSLHQSDQSSFISQLPVCSQRRLATNHQSTVGSHQSVASLQPSESGRQSAVSRQSSVCSRQRPDTSHRSGIVTHQSAINSRQA